MQKKTKCNVFFRTHSSISIDTVISVLCTDNWENSCYLVSIESPILEFFLEQRTTDVERVMQLASPVVVENLREDARMSVEEVLVEYRVVVGECLGEAGQPGRRDLLERCLIRLVSDATHVDRDAIINVRHYTSPVQRRPQ